MAGLVTFGLVGKEHYRFLPTQYHFEFYKDESTVAKWS